MHSLDNCVFLLYDGNDLIGLCGVYVDDFLIAGQETNPLWQKAKKKLIDLYSWGKWEKRVFHLCGVRYRQHNDYSVTIGSGREYKIINRSRLRTSTRIQEDRDSKTT